MKPTWTVILWSDGSYDFEGRDDDGRLLFQSWISMGRSLGSLKEAKKYIAACDSGYEQPGYGKTPPRIVRLLDKRPVSVRKATLEASEARLSSLAEKYGLMRIRHRVYNPARLGYVAAGSK